MLMEIAKAKEDQTFIVVVQGWAELVIEDDPRPTENGLRLISREGRAEPGGYVTILNNGPVQVQTDVYSASSGDYTLRGGFWGGDKLVLPPIDGLFFIPIMNR